jgi:sugar-specific transcriptional regulator TrmB
MRNSDEAAVKELRSIGLGSYESRAYVSLLRCGKLTPMQVADLAKIPNPRVYDVLRKLEAMRFVIREPKKREPRYRAIPIKTALKHYEGELNRQYMEKEKRIKKISSKIAKMITPTIPKEEITYVLDSDQITDWATKALAKAKKKAWGIIPHARNSVFDASNPKDTAAALKKKGIELKFLRKVTKDNIDFIKEMSKYAEIRHYPGFDFAFLDIDGKGVLLSAVPDDGTSDVGIWIGHPSMIKLFEDYFALKFKEGTPLNARIKELGKS